MDAGLPEQISTPTKTKTVTNKTENAYYFLGVN
jgi:hypothetical protein